MIERIGDREMRTTDRASSDVYTVEQIGRTQELTPEGFLLCRDVPIARTGEMHYRAGEVPVEVGRDMIARVTRDESVLMDPATIASYEGKPVTIDHPDEDVGPDNWRQLAVGVVRNVRPGDGIDGDKVLADLLITDRYAIDQVRNGLREVSCGYDAEYEDLGGGRGRQMSITGNHVALVARGRCGPVCSIGDSDMRTRDESQTTSKLPAWARRALSAFRTGDEDTFVKELQGAPKVAELDGDEPDDRAVNITLNLGAAQGGADADGDGLPDNPTGAPAAPADPMAAIMTALSDIQQRLTVLEGGGAAVTEPDGDEDDDGDGVPSDEDEDDEDPTKDSDMGDEDEDKKEKTQDAARRKTGDKRTVDSSGLETEFADTRARAEILSPGIQLPTFDSARARQATLDSICALRRRALAKVADEHRELIRPLVEGVDLRKGTCDSIRGAFLGASELVKKANESRLFIPKRPVRDAGEPRTLTISQMNERARQVWASKK